MRFEIRFEWLELFLNNLLTIFFVFNKNIMIKQQRLFAKMEWLQP